MKKIISMILSLLLLLSLSVSAFATEPDAPWVVDNAGLLSGDEVAELNRKIQALRSELELEIVIVTTYGTGYKNVQEYADDFYDVNGYGYGSDNSGILLLLDMEAREWYMSTCGDAIYIFTDYGLEALGQGILPYLADGDYYGAFSHWIEALPDYVERFRNGSPIDGYVQPDDYDSPYGDETVHYNEPLIKHPFPVALVIGLVAALITVLVMRIRMNTARYRHDAQDYLKKGSFRLWQRSDMFLYSRVSRKLKAPKNSSGGGGSSVHRSSGGVSHGGRGGKF
jgi:uncharacterized protein